MSKPAFQAPKIIPEMMMIVQAPLTNDQIETLLSVLCNRFKINMCYHPNYEGMTVPIIIVYPRLLDGKINNEKEIAEAFLKEMNHLIAADIYNKTLTNKNFQA